MNGRPISGIMANGFGKRLTGRLRAEARQTLWWWESFPRCAAAFLRNAAGERRYRILDAGQLEATRTSDTVFVFGSGRSLLDIDAFGWQEIARANTVSFREFPRQSFVRADYHVTGEVDDLEAYAARLRENPLYRDTVFVVQRGWRAFNGNDLIGRGLLPAGARVFRYRRTARGRDVPPSRSFDEGLVHGFGTVIGVVNFAFLMGWRTIVLAGVDLYDKRYFWLPADELRHYEKSGVTIDAQFTGASNIVSMLEGWRPILLQEGVELRVLNPRSLLAKVLPVHQLSGVVS